MAPQLSVVLAADGGYAAVRKTIEVLRRQRSVARMELIVIGFGGDVTVPPEVAEAFACVQTELLAGRVSVARANARGVRRATAPVVVFAEDHAFPQEGWAEALMEAHEKGYSVVGPAVVNANPGTLVSWCDFLMGYGAWMEPCEAGEREFLPGHNSSYKRDVLLGLGEELEGGLESETVLHYRLQREGHRLWLEPRARLAHVNFGRLGIWLPVMYHCGRLFGGYRVAEWGMGKRVLYAAASPLIPLVRWGRCAGLLRRVPRRVAAGALLLVGLVADGLGQMVGYVAGPGKSAEVLAEYEYNRIRFVAREEQQRIWG